MKFVRNLVLLQLVYILKISFSTGLNASFDHYESNDKHSINDYVMLISGGFRPPKHTYAKYLVSIRTTSPMKFFGDNHICAGTIVSYTIVITSAHCVMDVNRVITRAYRLLCVAGAPNRLREDDTTFTVDVAVVLPHPHFKRRGTHDLAVLRLGHRIPETNDAIKIIQLPDGRPAVGSVCNTVGWGQLYERGPYAAEVVYVNFTIMPDSYCRKIYGKFYIAETSICAIDLNNMYKDVCHGDSGGPLICNDRLVGLVSWSIHCGQEGLPPVFTNLAYYRKWVENLNNQSVLYKPIICYYIISIIILMLLY